MGKIYNQIMNCRAFLCISSVVVTSGIVMETYPNSGGKHQQILQQQTGKNFVRRVGEAVVSNAGQGLVSVAEIGPKIVLNTGKGLVDNTRFAGKMINVSPILGTIIAPINIGRGTVGSALVAAGDGVVTAAKQAAHKVYRIGKSVTYIGKSRENAIKKAIDEEINKLDSFKNFGREGRDAWGTDFARELSFAGNKNLAFELGVDSSMNLNSRFDIARKDVKQVTISQKDQETQADYYTRQNKFIKSLSEEEKKAFHAKQRETATEMLNKLNVDTKTIVLDRGLVKRAIKEAFDQAQQDFMKQQNIKFDQGTQQYISLDKVKSLISLYIEHNVYRKPDDASFEQTEKFHKALEKKAEDLWANNHLNLMKDNKLEVSVVDNVTEEFWIKEGYTCTKKTYWDGEGKYWAFEKK